MTEKLENDVFKIIEIDENVLAGDANKLKLLITSYAVIMEVQAAYMEEEVEKKREEQRGLEVELEMSDGKKSKEIKQRINELSKEIKIMDKAIYDFNKSHQRFMSLAHKALSLPDKNFQKLAENGWGGSRINPSVYLVDLQNTVKESQDSIVRTSKKTDEKGKKYEEKHDIFSSIDTDAIKQEVENVLNKKTNGKLDAEDNKYGTLGDFIASNVNAETFDADVKDLATEIKKQLDESKAASKEDSKEKSSDNKEAGTPSSTTDVTEDDFDRILAANDKKAEAITPPVSSEEDEKDEEDIFSKADEVTRSGFKATPVTEETSIFDTPVTPFTPLTPESTVEPDKPLESGVEQSIFNMSFDFSDDPAIKELEAQIEEAKGQYKGYQQDLREKEKEEKHLTQTRDEKAAEAKQKAAAAARLIEIQRIKARNDKLASLREELSDYKSKAIEAAAQINQTAKRNDSLRNEIDSYQNKIDESERIIGKGSSKK